MTSLTSASRRIFVNKGPLFSPSLCYYLNLNMRIFLLNSLPVFLPLWAVHLEVEAGDNVPHCPSPRAMCGGEGKVVVDDPFQE